MGVYVGFLSKAKLKGHLIVSFSNKVSIQCYLSAVSSENSKIYKNLRSNKYRHASSECICLILEYAL